MQTRKRKLTSGKRSPHICKGGPLDGKQIWLSTPGTLTFTLNGMTGRYNQYMEWRA